MNEREPTKIVTLRVTERMAAEIDRRAEQNYTTRNAAAVALIAAGLRQDTPARQERP